MPDSGKEFMAMAAVFKMDLDRERKFSTEEMATRRVVEKAYVNLKEMVDDGWTRDDLEKLIQVKHTQQGVCALPIIDGFKCPASLWSRAEWEDYKTHRHETDRPLADGPRTNGLKPEQVETLKSLLDIEAVAADGKAVELIRSLLPVSRIAEKLFGEEPIPNGTVYSKTFIMYRDGEGNRFPEKNISLAYAVALGRGLVPVMMPAELDKMLEQDDGKYKPFVID